jgi:hypothetical protein
MKSTRRVPHRCLLGTLTAFVSYREAVDAFTTSDRLTPQDRDALMGGTLERIFDWRPAG